MANGFNDLEGFDPTQVAPVETVAKPESGDKAVIDKAKEELKELLKDPNYIAVRNSRSGDLSVVKTLGYTDSKGLVDKTQEYLDEAVKQGLVKILDPADETPCEVTVNENGMPVGQTKKAEAGGKKKYVVPVNLDSKLDDKGKHKPYRRVTTESQVVGYRIKNESDTPVEYETEVFHKEEDGTWVGSKVQATMAPGATADISRLYLAKLLAREEFNMTLKNGILIGKISKVDTDIEAALAAQYFSFNKNTGMDVHSPEVKIQIGTPVQVGETTKYVVKDEFAETFGNLNNVEVNKTRGRKASGVKGLKPTPQELTAVAIRQALGL